MCSLKLLLAAYLGCCTLVRAAEHTHSEHSKETHPNWMSTVVPNILPPIPPKWVFTRGAPLETELEAIESHGKAAISEALDEFKDSVDDLKDQIENKRTVVLRPTTTSSTGDLAQGNVPNILLWPPGPRLSSSSASDS